MIKKFKFKLLTDIFISKICLVAIVFITDIALARILSVSDRGAVLAINSSVFFTASCITFGLEYGFLLIPELPSIRTIVKIYLKIIPYLLSVGIGVSYAISVRYGLTTYNMLFVMVLMCCEISTILILPCLLQYSSAISYGLIRVARRFLALTFILLIYNIFYQSLLTVTQCIFCFSLAWLIGLLSGCYILSKKISINDFNIDKGINYLNLVKPGSTVFLAKFCERFQTQVGLILLGFLGYSTAASLYAIGAQATEAAVFASGSISIGLLAKKGNRNILNKHEVVRIFWVIILLALLGVIFIWPFLHDLIVKIYGGHYDKSVPLVKMLAPALIIYSGYPLISTFLLRHGSKTLVVFANFFSIATNAATCFFAIFIMKISPPTAATMSLFLALSLNVVIVFLGSYKIFRQPVESIAQDH